MDEKEAARFVQNVFEILGLYKVNDQEIPITRVSDRFFNVVRMTRGYTFVDRLLPRETDFHYAPNETWQSQSIITAIYDLHHSGIFAPNADDVTGRLCMSKTSQKDDLRRLYERLLGDSISSDDTKEKLRDFAFRKIAEAYLNA